MSRHRMGDGIVVDTTTAQRRWTERCNWVGDDYVSVNTGSDSVHETLYLSRKGRYYVECRSDSQGSTPSASLISLDHAAAWLALNGHELPADLANIAAAGAE